MKCVYCNKKPTYKIEEYFKGEGDRNLYLCSNCKKEWLELHPLDNRKPKEIEV